MRSDPFADSCFRQHLSKGISSVVDVPAIATEASVMVKIAATMIKTKDVRIASIRLGKDKTVPSSAKIWRLTKMATSAIKVIDDARTAPTLELWSERSNWEAPRGIPPITTVPPLDALMPLPSKDIDICEGLLLIGDT